MYNTNFENFLILDVNLQKAAIENSRENLEILLYIFNIYRKIYKFGYLLYR